MARKSLDSFGVRSTLEVQGREVDYFNLAAEVDGIEDISRLPFSLKILLENLLRHEDGEAVSREDIEAMSSRLKVPEGPWQQAKKAIDDAQRARRARGE